MTIYFTSDTHYGHKNIIKYSNRPYTSVEQMDNALVDNWNKVVQPDDTVYHLGDFGFYSDTNKIVRIIQRLNGNKVFIFGNHDKIMSKPEIVELFQEMCHYKEIYVQDPTIEKGRQHIVLLHYGMRVWNKSHHGSWQLYGHSHGSLPELPGYRAFDVGVDCWDYTPISYNQVKAKMAKVAFQPVDHHGAE